MSFADNLIYIRQHFGVTQEAIAEQLGVSRQTVSKWEAGINYPETDKLLVLCDLYRTNLDDLMRGSVKISNEKDTLLYDAHMNRFGLGIALSIALILIGVGVLMLLEGLGVADNISTAAMLCFIVVGVLAIVVSGMNHSEFKRKNPDIDPSYPDEVLDRFGRRFTVMMAGSLGLIMLAVILMVALAPEEGDYIWAFGSLLPFELVTAAFMFLIAFGVGGLVFTGMQKSKYDKSEITQVFVDGSPSSQGNAWSGQRITPDEMRRNQIVGSLCGIIMLGATIVFFVIGLADGTVLDHGSWRDSGFAYSWIAFPVGGMLCGIVSIAGNLLNRSKESLIIEAQKEDPWVQVRKADGGEGDQAE